MTNTAEQLDKRCKLARPERIDIGDDELIRNDLIAKIEGTSERTVNRGDVRGAPFTLIGGVKYRPIKRYQAWRAAGIKPEQPQRIIERSRPRRHR
jgi:hypothetical protein